MPKKTMDFSRTLMYKIVCKDLTITELYVGHTSNFRVRKNSHKSICNNENSQGYNLKVYTYMRANGGFENFSMIEIEKFPCKDLNEAEARERYWIETLKANLNMNTPSRSIKEYRELNKDKIKEQDKAYRELNKDVIKEYQKEYDKEYYKQNKEAIALKNKKYQEKNKDLLKEKRKIYEEDNKEYKKEKGKEYRELNRDKINQKKREKYALKKGITP